MNESALVIMLIYFFIGGENGEQGIDLYDKN